MKGFVGRLFFEDMVVFRKVFGFKEIYIHLFRRYVPIANLFYFIPYLSGILTFGNECHSLTPYALKRVSILF